MLDAKSESKDTLMAILFDLHHRFIEGKNKQYLAIAAGAKLYDIIQALTHEYGEDFKWLIPTPGDWDMLKNIQVALMKPYFDMGLTQLVHTYLWISCSCNTELQSVQMYPSFSNGGMAGILPSNGAEVS